MQKIKTGISFLLVALILICGNICFSAGNKKIGYVKAVGTYGLKEDGSIWKINVFDDTVEKKIGDGFIDIDIDTSEHNYFGLKKNGSLLSWNDEKNTPMLVMKDVKSISAQTYLKKDGTVWEWYTNSYLGIDFSTQKPHKVYSGAVSVSCGELIYVLDKKGNLYCIDEIEIDGKTKTYKVSGGVIFITNNYFIKKDKSLYYISYDRKYDYEDLGEHKYRGLDISVEKVLNNVKYVDNRVPCDSRDIIGTSCAIKTDGSLWVFSVNKSSACLKESKGIPQKIMNSVKYAKCQNRSITIVKNNGELCEFGYRCPQSSINVPKSIMKNVKAMFEGNKVLTNDSELWLLYGTYNSKKTKLLDNVKEVLEDGTIIKLDGTKHINCYMAYGDGRMNSKAEIKKSDIKEIKGSYIIKKDNSIWRKRYGPHDIFYEMIDIKIDNVKEIYDDGDSLIYILKNDNTLWTAKPIYNSFEEKELIIRKYNNPFKILDEVKDVEIYGAATFVITKANELVGWSDRPDRIQQDNNEKNGLNITKVMEDIDSFDKKTSTLDIVKTDKSHWSFISNPLQFDPAKYNVSEIQKGANMDFPNTEKIKYYDDNKYITKDGEYWIRAYGLKSEKENPLKGIPFVKVTDNVIYAEEYRTNGLFVCTDNSLWKYSNMNSSHTYDYSSIKPVKMMDNVKEVHMYDSTIVALLNDGSLNLWEPASYNAGNISKPKFIIGDVSKFYFYGEYLFALKNDGTLLSWGYMVGENYYTDYYPTKNPISLVDNKNDKIKHYKYEAVGINEDIEIVAEIKDTNYLNNVKVIVDGKTEIMLERSTGNYFTGTIPGLFKEGKISYKIEASDTEGKTISTPVYNTEVVSNDCYLIDSEDKEVKISEATIFVNGEEIHPDVSPVIKSGRTLLELSSFAKALGAETIRGKSSREIWIKKGKKIVILEYGSCEVISNGKKSKIDVPIVALNGKPMIPAKALCDLLGAKITWDQINNKIEISS